MGPANNPSSQGHAGWARVCKGKIMTFRHYQSSRTWRSMASGALLLVLCGLTGCTGAVNLMALPYFLFAKDPTVPPRVTLVKGRKDAKKVLILCYADNGLQLGYDAIDESVAELIGREISAKEPRLQVIPERKVRAWRDLNPDWADHTLQSIGEHFDVDYVLFYEVVEYSLNDTKSQFLLKGRATVNVRIHDVNAGERILDDTYVREYPPHRAVPLNDIKSEQHFQSRFLQTVSRELSWYVLPHKFEDEPSDL